MSPDLLRDLLYVFAVVIGLLLARVHVDTRERRELRAKLKQANRFREQENVAAGTLTLTQQGNIELTIKPELTPGRLVTVEFTPAQADQLVESIVKVRKASAKVWGLN
jgi:hypothetical protein